MREKYISMRTKNILMITLEDLVGVKMDLNALKEGCLSPYKEIYFFKYLSNGELNPEIYKYILLHNNKECMELIGAIEGAKDLSQNQKDLWQNVKDTIFSP
jgi:hypothetical protein